MTSAQYAEQRKDPRWQMKRLRVMERDGAKCTVCEDGTKTLNVHHRYYVKGRKCWDYPMWALVTQCRDCHQEQHKAIEDTGSDGEEWEAAIGFLVAGNEVHGFGELWDSGFLFCQLKGEGLPHRTVCMIVERALKEALSAIKTLHGEEAPQ